MRRNFWTSVFDGSGRRATALPRALFGCTSHQCYEEGRCRLLRADIAELLDRLPADKQALRRNVYAVIRRLFKWSVARGDIDSSPLEHFEAPSPVASRDRVLNDRELAQVWRAATPGDWGILATGIFTMAAAMGAFLWWQGQHGRNEAATIWTYYEKRGLFDGDSAVRKHAQRLFDRSDYRALDRYCAAEDQRKATAESSAAVDRPIDRI